MLGREPVVDGHDDRTRGVGELARDRIELLGTADRPAAAVQVDDNRKRDLRRGSVDPDRDTDDVANFDVVHRFNVAGTGRDEHCEAVTRLLERLVRRWTGARRVHEVAHQLRLRVESHQRCCSLPRAARSFEIARSQTACALGTKACNPKNPWNKPSARRTSLSTPASANRRP